MLTFVLPLCPWIRFSSSFFQKRQFSRQIDRFGNQVIHTMIIIAFDHNRTAVQERNDLIGHLSEILLLYFTKRAKMIVDMLFAWLRQTTDTEHDLAGKIIP